MFLLLLGPHRPLFSFLFSTCFAALLNNVLLFCCQMSASEAADNAPRASESTSKPPLDPAKSGQRANSTRDTAAASLGSGMAGVVSEIELDGRTPSQLQLELRRLVELNRQTRKSLQKETKINQKLKVQTISAQEIQKVKGAFPDLFPFPVHSFSAFAVAFRLCKVGWSSWRRSCWLHKRARMWTCSELARFWKRPSSIWKRSFVCRYES